MGELFVASGQLASQDLAWRGSVWASVPQRDPAVSHVWPLLIHPKHGRSHAFVLTAFGWRDNSSFPKGCLFESAANHRGNGSYFLTMPRFRGRLRRQLLAPPPLTSKAGEDGLPNPPSSPMQA